MTLGLREGVSTAQDLVGCGRVVGRERSQGGAWGWGGQECWGRPPLRPRSPPGGRGVCQRTRAPVKERSQNERPQFFGSQ